MKNFSLISAIVAVTALTLFAAKGCTADENPPANASEAAPVTTNVVDSKPPVNETKPAGSEAPTDQNVAQAEPNQTQQPQERPPAPTADYREGQHYSVLNPAQPTSSSPDKIEVAELFWYGCPHCYTLDPYIERWKESMPANVSFVRLHATLNPSWRIHARAFYAAEALGVLDTMHPAMFRAIHDERKRLGSEDEIAALFVANGVDEKAFRDAFSSFAIETKLGRSDTLARRYRATGVPLLIVNGRYTTGARQANGNQNVMKVVDYLIAKEAARD